MSKFVSVKWDGIGKPGCVTVNGHEIMANHVKLEWGGKDHSFGVWPVLTLTQVIFPEDGEPAAVGEVSGYLVQREDWDAYQRWLLEDRRSA